MKNTIKILGIIVLTTIIGFYFIACDDGGNNGTNGGNENTKTVTFSLNKINSRTFTVTVEGAKWGNVSHVTPTLLADSNFRVVSTNGAIIESILWSNIFPHPSGITKTSDTVFTYTLGDSWQTATGTISFKANINGSSVTDGGSSANYVVNQARSSVTFP